MNALEHGFEVSGLRVIPTAGEVSGPGGRDKLDPKVMGVFLMMAEHAGEVVMREDLLARLWPDAVVTDDALTRCLYELRRHLSHAGGDERFRSMIETLPKRGYRLNASVQSVAPATPAAPAAPVPAARRGLWTAAGSTAALAAIAAAVLYWQADRPATPPAAATKVRSVAVLPFLDMSGEKDQRYFSDGVAEEILNRLAQSTHLRVIARTSSFAFRDETLDVPQIAARLNVEYVLEGSVRKSGDRIRITAQLIDAASNSHLWSKTYDRRVGDLFAVQDEIAGSVATALQATLGGRSVQARAPDSVEAYQSYLHGRFLFNRRLEGDVERAVGYYEEAIAKDPTYARAWAALAGASGLLARPPSGLDIGWLDRQREAALTAVKLDPNLAVAQARLAQYYWQTGQRAKGNAHFDKALALNPDDLLVLGFAAGVARRDGEIDRALEIWNRVVQRDPLSSINRGNYAAMLLEAGRLEEARVEFDKLFELNPDAGPEDKVQLVCVLTLLKRYDEAQALIAQLPDGEYRDFGLALQYEAPGRRAEADAALHRLRSQPADYRGSIRLAEAYAIRGRREDAFEVLQRRRAALERGDPSDVYQLWYFLDDTQANHLLKPLRADPRWSALTAKPG